ncbi:MAG TPA: chemotaxis protein CheW [Candidatus Dormibacteraeota bacterium]|nr:chemotaxis protein CheW [Candidatus Dormibacteraeota bacterium]
MNPNKSPELARAPSSSAAVSNQEHLLAEIETCWNKIGIYGNGECGELEKFVHCRNCPIYSQAAHRLLDRPLPPEYRREWAVHFAREEKKTPPAKLSAVLFRVSSEWLALPTQAFQEIAERRRVHSLPNRRQSIVLGVVNIRGELLVCVSLGRLLGVEQASSLKGPATYDRFLVANWEGNRLVFPADEVQGIHRFQAHELREPPATVAKANLSYAQGIFIWQQKPVGFLEPSTLFAAFSRSLA